MPGLSGALQALAEAAQGLAEAGVVPEDQEREVLPSDDEDGPADPDEEDDALAPGEQREEEAGETQAEAAAPAEAAGEAAAAGPPALQDDWQAKLKKPELQEQLRWRGLDTGDNKPELIARLQKAIDERVPVLASLPDKSSGGASGSSGARSEKSKVQWEPIDSDKISRPDYGNGPDKFVPNPDLKLEPETHPFDYMCAFYPKTLRELEVENSERYRAWLKVFRKEIYKAAPPMDMRINSLAHSMLLLQGMNPVPDQRKMYARSFAYKAHRGADLLRRDDWLAWKAFFHISHPGKMPERGSKEWDELYKVRPFLDAYLQACVNNVTAGRKFSIDEITIGFQGHHARLKMRCGKFKRAGDGFQVHLLARSPQSF